MEKQSPPSSPAFWWLGLSKGSWKPTKKRRKLVYNVFSLHPLYLRLRNERLKGASETIKRHEINRGDLYAKI